MVEVMQCPSTLTGYGQYFEALTGNLLISENKVVAWDINQAKANT